MKISILNRGGDLEWHVNTIKSSDFIALHRSIDRSDKFSVTHIRTGVAFGQWMTRAKAVSLYKELVSSNADFNFKSVKSRKVMDMKKAILPVLVKYRSDLRIKEAVK